MTRVKMKDLLEDILDYSTKSWIMKDERTFPDIYVHFRSYKRPSGAIYLYRKGKRKEVSSFNSWPEFILKVYAILKFYEKTL